MLPRKGGRTRIDESHLTPKGDIVFAEPAKNTFQNRLEYSLVLLDDAQYNLQQIVEWGPWLLQEKGM